MRLPELKIREIEAAREAVFDAARAVPDARLEWRPLNEGQSVLSMCRELAKTPDWAFYVLTDAKPDEPDDAAEAQREEMRSWRTVADCEAACRTKLEGLFELYRRFSDEDLARTKWLPFNGGRDHTFAELLDYPRWNFTYHQGQIDTIRSLSDPKRSLAFFPDFGNTSRRSSTKLQERPMRLQDHTIDDTRLAMEEAFNYAKAVPDDKLEWKPLGEGRSVLALCRELAKCPDWAYDIVSTKQLGGSEEDQAAGQAEMESWSTVAECETICKEKLGRYFELLKGVPDERLAETMDLPFGPGGSMKTFTMFQLMDYPRWNATYHTGQIAYVQTLYGDRDMH